MLVVKRPVLDIRTEPELEKVPVLLNVPASIRCAPEVLLKMPSLVSVPRLLMCPRDVLLIVPVLSSVLVRPLESVPPELLNVPELLKRPSPVAPIAEWVMLNVPLLLNVPELEKVQPG